MFNTLVSRNVMVNILPSVSLFAPPPSLPLSISLPTWALWWESTCRASRTSLVSFFSSDWHGLLGWLASCSPSWLSSCAAPVLVCTHTHSVLYSDTHTHTPLRWVDSTNNVGQLLLLNQSIESTWLHKQQQLVKAKNVTLTCVCCYSVCFHYLLVCCLGICSLRWKLSIWWEDIKATPTSYRDVCMMSFSILIIFTPFLRRQCSQPYQWVP